MAMVIDSLNKKRDSLLSERERIDREIAYQKAGHSNQYPEDYGKVSGRIKREKLANDASLVVNSVARKVLGSFSKEEVESEKGEER